MIDISHDLMRLITIDRDRLRVLDVKDGRILFDTSFDHDVVDLDLHPTEERVLVTLNHEWNGELPETQLISISWEGLRSPERFEAPEVSETTATIEPDSESASAEITAQQRAALRSPIADETRVDQFEWSNTSLKVHTLDTDSIAPSSSCRARTAQSLRSKIGCPDDVR